MNTILLEGMTDKLSYLELDILADDFLKLSEMSLSFQEKIIYYICYQGQHLNILREKLEFWKSIS